jgi:transcriptional regulator with XRE-family HTH domain|tara:strand:- start:156 stop:524 length:369 start_codon:yes stop_codon:yes gene_type:complete
VFHPTDIYIGQRIKEQRIAAGYSQAALAEKLGITFQQVQKYESGANRVGGSRLWDISKAIGTSITYFFEGLDVPAREANAETKKNAVLSRQSLELARAINSIPEGEVKDQVVKLVKAFSKSA